MTAVEFIREEFLKKISDENYKNSFYEIIEKAKKLEKQQMEKCAIFFTNYAIDKIENKTNLKGEETFEQYYKETFNNK